MVTPHHEQGPCVNKLCRPPNVTQRWSARHQVWSQGKESNILDSKSPQDRAFNCLFMFTYFLQWFLVHILKNTKETNFDMHPANFTEIQLNLGEYILFSSTDVIGSFSDALVSRVCLIYILLTGYHDLSWTVSGYLQTFFWTGCHCISPCCIV